MADPNGMPLGVPPNAQAQTSLPGMAQGGMPSAGMQQHMPQHMHAQFAAAGMQPALYHAPAPATSAQDEQLRQFWAQQAREVQQTGTDPAEFKNTNLPLARIKKIMKSDEDVRMISAEAPVLFAKACEMFILELTLRAWNHSEENKRRTLQRNDIAAAITKTDIFDFLVDIVPRDERAEGEGGPMGGGAPRVQQPTAAAPGAPQMYYIPGMPAPQQSMMPGTADGMMRPPGMDPMLYQYPPMMTPQGWSMPGIPAGMAGGDPAAGVPSSSPWEGKPRMQQQGGAQQQQQDVGGGGMDHQQQQHPSGGGMGPPDGSPQQHSSPPEMQ